MNHQFDDQSWSQPNCTGYDNSVSSPYWSVGMTYVPMQVWVTPMPIENGFMKGTVFQDLDKPFLGR